MIHWGGSSRTIQWLDWIGSRDTFTNASRGDDHLGKFHHELTTSSLEIIGSKGNHPQKALIQVSEIL